MWNAEEIQKATLGLAMEYGPKILGFIVLIFVAWGAAGMARRLTLKALRKGKLDETLARFFATAMVASAYSRRLSWIVPSEFQRRRVSEVTRIGLICWLLASWMKRTRWVRKSPSGFDSRSGPFPGWSL